MADQTNYCTIAEAVTFSGGKLTEDDFQASWLNMVDATIEQYSGQGYKGALKTRTQIGSGGHLLRLPSIARQIQQITENGVVLGENEYTLETDGRLIERVSNIQNLWMVPYTYDGRWTRNWKYVISYYEPDLVDMPEIYHFAAVNCMAIVAHFVQKYKQFGLALTASDYASATKVSTQASTTFPANLQEELKRTLQHIIRRSSI